MHGRIGFICLILIAGCSETPAPMVNVADTPLARLFDPGTTGTIQGRVVWDGDVPAAEETVVRMIAYNPYLYQNPPRFLTPHVPKVQTKNAGVANAVVYLKNVDPQRSRPWDHAPVSVEFNERSLRIAQGGKRTSVGFVRRGAAIAIVNRDKEYHLLRARGSAFFSAPLIEANQIQERTLTQAGVVDLTCGAGYYWLNAQLFVAEHPYYVQTDVDGYFALDQVPAGTYEIVCWQPSWRVLRTERDPETADIARLIWDAPKEQTQTVNVQAGQTGELTYRWNRRLFEND